MHQSYEDIRSKIAAPPQWWDSNGVPRYAPFGPQRSPNIYARECVLLEIACQACGERFGVEMHGDAMDGLPTITELHYGDPPWHACGGAGMPCEARAILEYWVRIATDWQRVPALEGPLPQENL